MHVSWPTSRWREYSAIGRVWRVWKKIVRRSRPEERVSGPLDLSCGAGEGTGLDVAGTGAIGAFYSDEPVWDMIRSDPHFQDLQRRIGLSP